MKEVKQTIKALLHVLGFGLVVLIATIGLGIALVIFFLVGAEAVNFISWYVNMRGFEL